VPPWLLKIFKNPDGQTNWPRVGAVIAAVAGAVWTVFTFVVEHKGAHDQGPTKEQIEQIQKPLAEQLAAQNALIKMLTEKNPAAAGPGVQQAVGAAVQSIAQGAEEGDTRLEKALGLLKENKIAEASKLLKEVAEAKTAHAEQATQQAEKAAAQAEKDRKDAAVAYRNLGAIAGLADPKRALEAFEKALALDPDDIKSLFWAGWIQIEYGDLLKAQSRLARVLELAKGAGQSFYEFWALTGVGDILVKKGNLPEALKSYQDELAIIERLANSDPGNAEWQRDLIISYKKIADCSPPKVRRANLSRALEITQALYASGRLAPKDEGMVSALAKLIAETPAE